MWLSHRERQICSARLFRIVGSLGATLSAAEAQDLFRINWSRAIVAKHDAASDWPLRYEANLVQRRIAGLAIFS